MGHSVISLPTRALMNDMYLNVSICLECRGVRPAGAGRPRESRRRAAVYRAQLHGDIVAPEDKKRAQPDSMRVRLTERLDGAAPNFYPRVARLTHSRTGIAV